MAWLQVLLLSLEAMRAAGLPTGTDRLLHAGGHPRIHADGLEVDLVVEQCLQGGQ